MTNRKPTCTLILSSLFILSILVSCGDKKSAPEETIEPAISVSDDGFISIFDGKSLENWDGDATYWRVEDGNLVGEVTPTTLLQKNTFIIWKGGQPADFELELEFRIADAGNSGINYRSELLDSVPFALRGYQADIDGKNTYTGQNYEERKRTTLAYRGEKVSVSTQPNAGEPTSFGANLKHNAWQSREVLASLGNADSLKTKIAHEEWNSCHLVVKGNLMQHYVNGILMSEVIDNDTVNRNFSGHLGVQVHVGPPMKVEYRNIRLKNL